MRVLLPVVLGLCALALAACPGAKAPKGPPPEYEDAPPPASVNKFRLDAGVFPATLPPGS